MKWLQRLGWLPQLESSIWVHAASLGELKSAVSLIRRLQNHYPLHILLVTTQTDAGFAYAQQNLSDSCTVSFLPLDVPPIVWIGLWRANPIALICIENAIWPFLYRASATRQIPVMLVNAKLGDRSDSIYQRFPWFARWMVRSLSLLIVPSPKHVKRFQNISPVEPILSQDLKFTV